MNNFDDYFSDVQDAANKLEKKQVERAYLALNGCARLYIMGNGGSAASADHWVCDYMKGINEDTKTFPAVKAISLVSNGPLVTAIANDIGYEHIFSRQLDYYRPNPEDVILAISASGNSSNIINGLYKARESGAKTIALTGFDGGLASTIADISIIVPSHNYGVVEDIHMMILHSISQRIRYWHAVDRSVLKL